MVYEYLKQIEKDLDNTDDIFKLLDELKTLAILQQDRKVMMEHEILVTGLIERIQESIVLLWYS